MLHIRKGLDIFGAIIPLSFYNGKKFGDGDCHKSVIYGSRNPINNLVLKQFI